MCCFWRTPVDAVTSKTTILELNLKALKWILNQQYKNRVLMLLGAFYASANMIFCAVGLFVLRVLLLSILRITLKTNTDVWEAAVGH